jgi:quinol-cytochrome oxidoreductase complex cytochrome b subunit
VFDLGALIFLLVLCVIIVLVVLGLMVWRNPVITEFEARQRGISFTKRSEDEIRSARERSDATTKTAFEVFGGLAVLLVVVSLVVYAEYPEFLGYMVPVFVALGILFLFAVMWLDEQKVKSDYRRIRIER